MTLAPLTLPAREDWTDWLRARVEEEVGLAEALVAVIKDETPTEAREVLALWDRAGGHLSNVGAAGSLFGNVHPDDAVRRLGDEAEARAERIETAWSLDRELYDVFAGLSADGLDPQAARLLAQVLRDFRRAGVDRDEATRARIAEIRERLTELDQEFSRVIRSDVRTIRVAPERLAGMPADWLAAHPADEDGLVTVTTDYPDAVPTRMFAHDRDVRHDMTVAFLQRGWPDSEPLLTEMFALRHELAVAVGHDDWPSLDAEVKMIGTGAAIPEFIDRIADAAEEPMRRDLGVLLERYRRDHPDATEVAPYDAAYYTELVRQERYAVDSQRVRTYFDFAKVRAGLLEVTGRLFGLRYVAVDAPSWHEEVATYDVHRVAESSDGGEPADTLLGRIHLDLHPREGKYKHAAQFTLTEGVRGRSLPEGVLVCNFARGLMEHDHVVTLFHEFGHLLHHVLAGHGDWAEFAGVATEWDFVEAPSQMLEEWAWRAEVLQTFATDAAGEPIPADLVAAMREADDFGKGIDARTQMFYAAMSYWFHRDRAEANPPALTDRMVELQGRYAALPYLEGTHMFASFGHLGGYSSGYYTYMWSLVIAKDMFSAFDAEDLFAPGVAARYRDSVLVPGGAKDAADLVADFLGRPYSFDAYAAWLAD
ncbi:Zn-dependent oligopeptidase [Nocardioides panacisoli]|uniref:M3 family metallopeptidase n=1 Tax=Nocardioides panacisoli TaxID=627624 RepID=UPI001C62DEB8|nr:M3 family metallopeptidase [Nocardioides panacisoli]QYJ03413.1 Zn-dependent oligopeptidase [Nocardioides panacisoli]